LSSRLSTAILMPAKVSSEVTGRKATTDRKTWTEASKIYN